MQLKNLRTGAVSTTRMAGTYCSFRSFRLSEPYSECASCASCRAEPICREKRGLSLHIEVQVELPRVGAEPDSVYLRTFVLDPDIDHILGEDASLEQELVIRFERINGLFK